MNQSNKALMQTSRGIELRGYCNGGCDCLNCHTGKRSATKPDECPYCQYRIGREDGLNEAIKAIENLPKQELNKEVI